MPLASAAPGRKRFINTEDDIVFSFLGNISNRNFFLKTANPFR